MKIHLSTLVRVGVGGDERARFAEVFPDGLDIPYGSEPDPCVIPRMVEARKSIALLAHDGGVLTGRASAALWEETRSALSETRAREAMNYNACSMAIATTESVYRGATFFEYRKDDVDAYHAAKAAAFGIFRNASLILDRSYWRTVSVAFWRLASYAENIRPEYR